MAISLQVHVQLYKGKGWFNISMKSQTTTVGILQCRKCLKTAMQSTVQVICDVGLVLNPFFPSLVDHVHGKFLHLSMAMKKKVRKRLVSKKVQLHVGTSVKNHWSGSVC